MNRIDEQLGRLFRAAAQVQPETDAVTPFGLETRVLAAWREGHETPSAFWDSTVLVRGFLLASVIMALSFVPALTSTGSIASSSTTNPFSEYLQLTDSTVSSDETP
jgi:hypothetical protein